MAVTGSVNFTGTFTERVSKDLGASSDTNQLTQNTDFTDGTGAAQVNLVWSDTRSLSASTSENLDLAGGLTSGLGATLTFARIKHISIRNNTTTAGFTLEVGGAASNAFSTLFGATADYLIIRPGGVFTITAPDAIGYVVTAGTADILKINNPNGGGAVSYSIVIAGSNA